ncbi:MAG: ABC transporter permease [Bacteroidetes bacterium]|nr:ABC transporter permease [Bacteroidota bacterium]
MFETLKHIGAYGMLMKRVLSKPERWKIYKVRIIDEMDKLGVSSLGLVILLSIFMGAVICLQTATNIDSPLIPMTLVGYATRESVILELAPTMLSLILAGKVGSSIASELGSMRVTEQIDALDIMGVNSASYLILPKLVSALVFFPFLIIISMVLGIFGGYIVSVGTGILETQDYIDGIHLDFKLYHVFYAMVKTLFFAAIITTVSAYYGYTVKGGSLEVGKNSTKGVVSSSILILVFNYLLTQIMLI